MLDKGWRKATMCSLILAMTVGCGSNKFPVASASGTVSCEGKPVTKGSVTFTPIGEAGALETGKAATAAIAADGSFKLSTFGRFDGAIVGKHRVEFSGTEGESEDEPAEDDDQPTVKPKTKSKQAFNLAQELIVEVKARGDNVFQIELSKAKN